MKKVHLLILTSVIVLACSSGKKAYEKGDYYEAVVKSVNHLKKNPGHSKSKETLKSAYPLALQNLEQQAQNSLASNDMFKYKNTIAIYKQINALAEVVKSSPAALTVIKSPKSYYKEIGDFKPKASEELYTAGIQSMMKGNRHDSRRAYYYFQECESFVPKYKEALEMMTRSEKDGTLNVMYEETAHSYWTNSANFIKSLDQIQFVDITHKNVAVTQLDKMNFDLNMLVSILDYTENQPKITKKEQEVIDSVKVGEKIVNNVKVPAYQRIKGKYISYEKVVESVGKVAVTISDKKTGNIVFTQEFQGHGRWSGTWAACSGDSRVFSKTQKQACDSGEPKPDEVSLKNQAKQDIDKVVFSSLSSFLKEY